MPDQPQFRTLESNTRFTFVRHGESEANRLRQIQGHSNSPLSETGREHARAAGQWLKDTGVELVFSSPLDRSRDTAAIICEETGSVGPVILDELKELNTGSYSGQDLGQAAKADPEAFAEFRRYSWDAVAGAESRDSLYARAMRVWDTLIETANDGASHIVCVSHGGMLQWIIKSTIPGDHRWMPVFGMANCGISTLFAQSTSLGVEREFPPGTGYFANWDHINQIPY